MLLQGTSPLPSARYRRYFEADAHLVQSCNALLLTEQQLNQPIAQQDPTLHRTLVQYLKQIHPHGSTDLLEQVRRLVLRLLPTQQCRLPLIAEQLGLQARTLQRQLAKRGQGFEEIVDSIRRERADAYLPLSHIAGLLGYSEQSVFNRACRRWFAPQPGMRRRMLLDTRPPLN